MITGCAIRGISPLPKASISRARLKSLVFAALITAVLVPVAGAQIVISNGESLIDFGCVGSDFKVFANFHLLNRGNSQVKVKSINVPCSCSEVHISDSTLNPGDSSKVRLTFDTKNLYGKTIRSFKIYTSDTRAPEIEYAYRCIVGQWLYGLRPDPTSLFFLPAIKSKRLAFNNPALERVNVRILDQADTTFTIKLLSDKAVKGGKAELEVTPRENLKAGTYLSSFRVQIESADGREPVLMTIPVKIVRY